MDFFIVKIIIICLQYIDFNVYVVSIMIKLVLNLFIVLPIGVYLENLRLLIKLVSKCLGLTRSQVRPDSRAVFIIMVITLIDSKKRIITK